MAEKTVRVGIIGTGFMGKAHSNAWLKVNKFFTPGATAVMKTACDVAEEPLKAFAANWGWEQTCTDWRKLVESKDIDLVDICTPNNTHAEIATAAAKAGKHILCEKPLAMSVAECEGMVKAVKKAGVQNLVSFSYRRVPAVALAKRIVEEGRLGRIFHVRAVYLQDWIIDPEFPLVWRLKKEIAGSGAHGDLNAHIIDMSRWLVGEIKSLVGMTETFIKERPELAEAGAGLSAAKAKGKGEVTVDDATLFLARFENGAVGTFEATRFAQGRKNGNRIEINGEKGSLVFAFERMNELELFSAEDPPHLQGFRTILATEPSEHAYISAWWPPGHIIGYEHTFINQAADILQAVAEDKPLQPDFADATKTQAVLDAVLKSAEEDKWIDV